MESKNKQIHLLAIKLYGLHRANTPLGYPAKIQELLKQKMIAYAKKIEELGANITYGFNGINKFPVVIDLDNNRLAYDGGRLECERIITLINEELDYFIHNY